ncbi:MAG: glycogen debranching enzyme [Thermoanaerobaculia bacterium]|nr:glycogen debranching enzyme [Thermoanaerobaculia bacterium]
MTKNLDLRPGTNRPFGPSLGASGQRLNLALWAPEAMAMSLQLRSSGQTTPWIALDAERHRQDGVWHAEVAAPGEGEVLEYRWRIDPESEEERDPRDEAAARGLLDPYAPLVLGGESWGVESHRVGQPKVRWSGWCRDTFDWQGVEKPRVAPGERVIYELNVRGYTAHFSSSVDRPGTYRGLIEQIPYWRELGVTTVELLPVAEFDELEIARRDPSSGAILRNLWGYSPLSFFAPKAGFAASSEPGAAGDELKELIRECHRVGVEVVLDVVFNHTAEKELEPADPVYSWVALDRGGYYLFDEDGQRRDVTGCGNTFASGSGRGSEMILAALRHWRREYRVDGFRFDLAAALTRDASGEPMADPSLIRSIASDAELEGCLLIAEAWDAAGLYRLGEFPQWGRWQEWNGRFRDDVRRFVSGEPGLTRTLALRLLGSPDLYPAHGSDLPPGTDPSPASPSINYLAAHDGFPLADVVSYSSKHNEANGENNRDGDGYSPSWNGGIEGPTDDPLILEHRERQVEMMLVVLLLSRGTPMLLAGDEFGRTQGGNNNSYCQDNPVGWVDWRSLARHAERRQLVEQLIDLRRSLPELGWPESVPEDPVFSVPEIVWHGVDPLAPDWGPDSQFLAVEWRVADRSQGPKAVYVAFNASAERRAVETPGPAVIESPWLRILPRRVEISADRVELGPWETLLLVDSAQ